MFVKDFYPAARQSLATCDEATTFEGLTDAIRLLSNKTQGYDAGLGELTICTQNGILTLPRDVGTILGINVCGAPVLLQDQFFQYHINGPGSTFGPCGVITELGEVCTYRDITQPAYLLAEVESAADNNKKLRVYATDANGKKIFTEGPNGTMEEGFLVPTIFGFSARNPDVPAISAIYNISKEATRGYVKLIAVNAADGVSQTKIGYYEPSETLPRYRRVSVPYKSWVRIKYKKTNIAIRSLNDFINIDNNEALRLACRAVKYRRDDQWDKARTAEDEATRILSEEIENQRPSGPRVPQIINSTYGSGDGEDSLIYGGWGWGTGGNNQWGN